ncbi:MAG: hypothetical protein AAFP02_17330 [Bacteroidota bacterium]
MKQFLLVVILLGTLSGNAQIRFSFGSSVATGLSSYAPTLSFVSPGQSSEVGFFGEYAWQEWYYIRIGLSFSAPQLQRPHFSRRFAYLGVPISVGLTPRGQDAIGPLFQTRYQAAFHLGGSDAFAPGPKSLVAPIRHQWGLGAGLLIPSNIGAQEIVVMLSLNSPLNDNYEDGGSILPLLGTILHLEWNYKL